MIWPDTLLARRKGSVVLDAALIRRKLAALLKYLNELQPLAQATLADYEAKYVERHAAEKLTELIVEYATAINRVILEDLNQLPPQTYYNTFVEMERLSIIPANLTPPLASATGLRNRLIHRYDEIDNSTVYYSLKPLLKNYRRYARLIEDYLQGETAAKKKKKQK